jgi:hypothetical protein
MPTITFRLLTKQLIFNHQNIARRVEANVDIIELCSAFQSEKTGSTPVGSATTLLGFLVRVLTLSHGFPIVFSTRRSFAVLFQLWDRRAGALAVSTCCKVRLKKVAAHSIIDHLIRSLEQRLGDIPAERLRGL